MSIGGKITLQGGTEDAPSPTSGHLSYYIKSGMLYSIDSDGTIFPVGIGVPGPPGPPGPAGAGANLEVEYIVLNGTEMTAKNVTLAVMPLDATKVLLDIPGGCSQRYGIDFTVSGNILSWSGLVLDGQLATSDVLRVSYTT